MENLSLTGTAVFPEGAFAIVEIMGHQKVAGQIHQVQFGAESLLQVVLPALPELPAQDEAGVKSVGAVVKVKGRYTRAAVPARPAGAKLFSHSALFCITLCAEADAIADEEDRREKPYTVFVPDPGEEGKMPQARRGSVPDPFGDDEDMPDPFAQEELD
jgi:hypothetical protein